MEGLGRCSAPSGSPQIKAYTRLLPLKGLGLRVLNPKSLTLNTKAFLSLVFGVSGFGLHMSVLLVLALHEQAGCLRSKRFRSSLDLRKGTADRGGGVLVRISKKSQCARLDTKSMHLPHNNLGEKDCMQGAAATSGPCGHD